MGAGAKVLDGVTIGAHAIVGAGAVLSVNVPDRGVAMGRPARVVGSRDEM
jgi:acetyltransferase-like isoleucine patch superfamily enzyme